MSLGARVQNVMTFPAPVGFAELWAIDAAATTAEIARAHAYFAERYP